MRFLNAFQDTPDMHGFWVWHGDDLAQSWLLDTFIAQNPNVPRIRLTLTSVKIWQEALGHMNSMGLFDARKILILEGKQKMDKAALEIATALGSQAHQNTLIWLSPRLNKRDLGTKALAPFQAVDCTLYPKDTRPILDTWARRLGLGLDADAVNVLMDYGMHDLLGAQQTLWRLSHAGIEMASAKKVQEMLGAGAQFGPFDLTDALLKKDARGICTILTQLLDAKTPLGLMFYTLKRDCNTVLDAHLGKPIYAYGTQKSAFLQLGHNLSPKRASQINPALARLDQSIKGQNKELILLGFVRVYLLLLGIGCPSSMV